MNNKLYQKLETIGTVLWFISDFIWMCGYNSLAAILITPVVFLMSLALYHFLNPPTAISWYYATQRHSEIQNRQVESDDENHIDLSQFEDLK